MYTERFLLANLLCRNMLVSRLVRTLGAKLSGMLGETRMLVETLVNAIVVSKRSGM